MKKIHLLENVNVQRPGIAVGDNSEDGPLTRWGVLLFWDAALDQAIQFKSTVHDGGAPPKAFNE